MSCYIIIPFRDSSRAMFAKYKEMNKKLTFYEEDVYMNWSTCISAKVADR